MRAAWLVLLLGVGACSDRQDAEATASSELSTPRRVRLDRLKRVNALARLYIGRELRRDELTELSNANEAAVVASLVARPEFSGQLIARAAAFRAAEGRGARSEDVDPAAPLADAFKSDAAEGERFGRWLVGAVAPRVAGSVSVREAMSYRELLDAIRRAARGAS
jgi:hypothetical protein